MNYSAPSHYSYPVQDDEIDLFELAGKLWQRKLIIIVITTAVTLASAIVAFMLPPQWESEARIYLSPSASFAKLDNVKNELYMLETKEGAGDRNTPPLHSLTPTNKQAYNLFYRMLSSPATLRQVFEQGVLKTPPPGETLTQEQKERLFDRFTDNVKISRSSPEKDGLSYTTIQYTSMDKHLSAELINQYLIPLVNEKTVKSLTNDLHAEINQVREMLRQSIIIREKEYLAQQQLEHIQLTEALKIAEAGGIVKPASQNIAELTPDSYFLLGSDIIKTRLELLKDRSKSFRLFSDTDNESKPLLPSVTSLSLDLQVLDAVTLKTASISPVTIEQPAVVPTAPIKPKKSLIIALGLVLGGMLGVFYALINIAITNRQEKQRMVVDSFQPTDIQLTPEPTVPQK